MSVHLDPPPRAPRLIGQQRADMNALYDFSRASARWMKQAYERMGGADDAIAATTTVAATASSSAAAANAGVTVPTEGGAITLTPSNPLSSVNLTATTAQIDVAGHTRTGAAAAIVAGSVPGSVARDATYYVWYNDPGDAGGAVTFEAATSLSTFSAGGGDRLIGTIYIAPKSYTERDTGSL